MSEEEFYLQDLLNKIANGEEVPKKIKFGDGKNSAPFPSLLAYFNLKGDNNE